MGYLALKSLHIIFVVTWFAGLFYMVRLFVHFIEANDRTEPEKSILQTQYKKMMRGLWYGITWPSLVLTLIFGTSLLWKLNYWFQPFMIAKLCFVFGLIMYHFICDKIFKDLNQNIVKISSFQMRLWNEIASIFLFIIVFIIVFKSQLNTPWAIFGFASFSLLILGSVYFAKIKRDKTKK